MREEELINEMEDSELMEIISQCTQPCDNSFNFPSVTWQSTGTSNAITSGNPKRDH